MVLVVDNCLVRHENCYTLYRYKMTGEIPDNKSDLVFCLIQLHNRSSQTMLDTKLTLQ
jgi:hypothetical protein